MIATTWVQIVKAILLMGGTILLSTLVLRLRGLEVFTLARGEAPSLKSSLVEALGGTMRSVFPNVYVLDMPDYGSSLGNSLVIATKQPTRLDNFAQNVAQVAMGLGVFGIQSDRRAILGHGLLEPARAVGPRAHSS
jgi:Na+(H+)/acetate symporter ActP